AEHGREGQPPGLLGAWCGGYLGDGPGRRMRRRGRRL
ncbi:MAG: hypothetical protein AVDCRST_MAG01-01-4817, partial [uncultured Rubrobacteraceae bacterium]